MAQNLVYCGIMQIKTVPEDFVVQEVLSVSPSGSGRYAVYRVQKRALTTLQVQNRLAAALGLPRSAVEFPALKDRRAVTVQFGTVCGAGPRRIEDAGFTAERVGRRERPLSPRDLAGNRFTVILRDLEPGGVEGMATRLAEIARWGVPNYFDDQRFGSRLKNGEFPGRLILRRDKEGALRAFLAGRQVGDPASICAFKAFAAEHWGDWGVIFERAPKPSNYRSVLTYLRDHPQDYRRALNLVTPRLLSLYLAAYQSWLWNRLAGRYLQTRLAATGLSIEVAGERLPVYRQLSAGLWAAWRDKKLPLLHHRLQCSELALERLVEGVLWEEGFQVNDLKARVLRRAYLSKGSRSLLLAPKDMTWGSFSPDERFAGRQKLTVRFFLPRGSYATLLLKAVAS